MRVTEQTPGRENGNPSLRETAASNALVPAQRLAPSPPSRMRRWWLWVIAGLLGLVLVAVASSQFWMPRPTPVSVEVVTLAPVTRVLAVNGRIAAVHSVGIRSTVGGALAALSVAEGDVVDAGQVLARIEADAQNAVVRQAMAALDASLIAQDEARQTYNRSLALGTNIARSVLETQARAVQTADQEVSRQTSVLTQAQIALRDHTIRAPMRGTVLVLEAEQGQIVDPATPLLTLADLSELMVEADVDEAYATQIGPDQRAVLQLAGETDLRDGHVSFVSRQVDVATGGLAVRIAFDDPVAAPVGLTVAANIIVDQRDEALTVPRTALKSDGDATGVYVVGDGAARFRPTTVVDWPAARLVVTSGLTEGDAVVIDAEGIAEGQAVSVEQP
ncbi:RND family efflux transporter MFP subunit [Silicimonas algicola]|uniref:RND family efflux transporter MFP subunit n=1 Tax=Silicimonas algicola TaxID=1826607 RepID=A0A316FZH3_9RHOB|nr:RND family efflux transporter MFP subunit [Silicimonas algicola]